MLTHRFLLPLFFALLWADFFFAQTYFSRHYGEDTDNGKALVQLDDGGFMTLGYVYGDTLGNQLQLNRFNAAGDVQWTKHYGNNKMDIAGGMIRMKNGNLVLFGGRTIAWGPPDSQDAFLLCIDLSGSVLWEKIIGKTIGPTYIYQIMETPDGNMVAVGSTVPTGKSPQNFIAKLSNNSTLLWEKTFSTANSPHGLTDVVITPDGYYAMSGSTTISVARTDAYLLVADTSGQVLWTQAYTTGKTAGVGTLLTAPGGGFLLAGDDSESGSNPHVLLIRTNPDGDTLWQRQYPVNGRYTTAYDGVEVPGQGFVMTGVIKGAPNVVGHRVYLLHVDYNGDMKWEREFEIEPPNGLQTSSAGYAIIRTSDGGFAITGDWFNGVRKELILIKTNASGIVASGEATSTPDINIYPNPVGRERIIALDIPERATRVDIFAPAGQLILSETLADAQQTITLALPPSSAPGVYSVVLYDRSVRFFSEKVVVH